MVESKGPANVPHTAGLHPTYYNIENEEGVKISVELIRGGLNWQMLVEEEWQYMER